MRMTAHGRAAGLGLFLAATGLVAGGSAAEPDLSVYQGAWIEQSLSCEPMFVKAGKGMAFRKPVDIFVAAFIISGNRLRTPQASCRITSVRPNGARFTMTLSCENSVSTGSATALLAPTPDGRLKRFFNEQDMMGSTYTRCAP